MFVLAKLLHQDETEKLRRGVEQHTSYDMKLAGSWSMVGICMYISYLGNHYLTHTTDTGAALLFDSCRSCEEKIGVE